MGSPSEAEVRTQIGAVIHVFDELRKFGHVNTPNLDGLEDTFIQSLEGDYAAQAAGAFAGMRAQLAGAVDQAPTILMPLLLDYGKVLGVPETDPQAIITRLIDHFIANSYTVSSRGFSFGSPTAGGSNVGTGVLHALNTDENDMDIEAQHAELKTAECVQDEHSGASEHAESFWVRGKNKLRDGLHIAGSGVGERIISMNGRDTGKYLRNPSFSQHTGDPGSVTAIYGWTVGTIGNFDIDTTNYYRGFPGDSPRSLKISANDALEQNLNVMKKSFPPNVPMFLQVAWNRSIGSGADATITLTLGSQTASIAVASLSGWQILKIAIGQKNWFRTWNQEDPLIKIAVTGLSSGYLLLDDIIFQPYTYIDGGWYALVGGATPFLFDDEFTWTDSIASDKKLNQWFWRTFRRYLPHTTGTASWADPS